MSPSLEESVRQRMAFVQGLAPATVDKPTLVYFDIVGIGWPIRCLLHLQQVEYHYQPISIMEWMFTGPDGTQPLKASFRNGHMPLYVDSEGVLNQSTQILEGLGDRYDMMGDSAAEAAAVRSLLIQCYDAIFHFNGLLPVLIRVNIPDDVAQARLDAFMGRGVWGVSTNGYRNNLTAFGNYLAANGSAGGFMVGERLSVADLCAFNILCNWYKAFDRQVFVAEYPALEAYIQHIARQPGIADYICQVQEPTAWFPLPDAALRLTSPEDLHGLVDLPG